MSPDACGGLASYNVPVVVAVGKVACALVVTVVVSVAVVDNMVVAVAAVVVDVVDTVLWTLCSSCGHAVGEANTY